MTYIVRDDCQDIEEWTSVMIKGPSPNSIFTSDVEIIVPLGIVSASNWANEVFVPHGFEIIGCRYTAASSQAWKRRWSSTLLDTIGHCYHTANRNRVESLNWHNRASFFSQTDKQRDDAEAQRGWQKSQALAQNAVFYIKLVDVLRAQLEYANAAIISEVEDIAVMARLNLM